MLEDYTVKVGVLYVADVRESSQADRCKEIDGKSGVLWVVAWKQALECQRKQSREGN